MGLWRTELGKVNEKAGQSLADPEQYENLFPGFQESLKTQQFVAENESELLPAEMFTKIPMNIERNAYEEMLGNESQGNFKYSKIDKPVNGNASELVNQVKTMSINENEAAVAATSSEEAGKARKNSLDEFDLDEDLDENIDTSDVNLDDEELLSD